MTVNHYPVDNRLMGYDDLLSVMDYLGYHVYVEGEATDAARRVAHEMNGKYTKSNFLPTMIASEWARLVGPVDKID
jgi:hypothetical protein